MALCDHFRAPLYPRYDRHSFLNAWATTIAYDLDRRLPERYFAQPNVLPVDLPGTYDQTCRGLRLPVDAGAARPSPAET